jgi:hypothetical protein
MAAVYTTLVEAKAHCRIDFSDDDTIIAAIQEMVEQYVLNEITGSFIGEGTVTTTAVVAIVGVETNFSDFQVGDIIKVEGETDRTIATITDDEHLTVSSAFVTTDTDLIYTIKTGMPLVGGVLPLPLKHALFLMIEHFYSIRGPVLVGVNSTTVPLSYQSLIAPYKNWTIA